MAWMGVQETANYLGISKETVYRMLLRKDIPSHRIGKLWKFDSVELDTYVKSGKLETKKGRKSVRSTKSTKTGSR
jgi:excisionase family DNA binding protein